MLKQASSPYEKVTSWQPSPWGFMRGIPENHQSFNTLVTSIWHSLGSCQNILFPIREATLFLKWSENHHNHGRVTTQNSKCCMTKKYCLFISLLHWSKEAKAGRVESQHNQSSSDMMASYPISLSAIASPFSPITSPFSLWVLTKYNNVG